ncbi:MAG: hypothetical protein HOP15_02430 [Planctomycetes bacterium]|nr:hypothetical protein [Planctomycetota bacterium]
MRELPRTGLEFRGPLPSPLAPGSYFVCVGAAQTLGCFCEQPFPSLLAETLGLPVLNLGYGGAGPAFFLAQPVLLEIINAARFAVVQVMSARSESNSRFDSGGLEYLRRRSDGARLGAAEAWQAELDGVGILATERASWLRWCARRVGRFRARGLVAETRRNWIESNRRLAAEIRVPKMLFWFSTRAPRYTTSYRNLGTLFAAFPNLVNEPMLAAVRPHFDRTAECVSSRGSPQLLRSRFTGAPCTVDPGRDRPDLGGTLWTHNYYYPSPEMHQDAALALQTPLRDILARA